MPKRRMLSIVDGESVRVVRVDVKASTNDEDAEAQKSIARSLGRPKNSFRSTFSSMSSSKFSCKRTSWTAGISSRHLRRVLEVKFCTSAFVCRLRPSPTEVVCERSSRLTIVPKPGHSEIWCRNLAKMEEWGRVIWR